MLFNSAPFAWHLFRSHSPDWCFALLLSIDCVSWRSFSMIIYWQVEWTLTIMFQYTCWRVRVPRLHVNNWVTWIWQRYFTRLCFNEYTHFRSMRLKESPFTIIWYRSASYVHITSSCVMRWGVLYIKACIKRNC